MGINDEERMARALAEANGRSWSGLGDVCHIELSGGLGTKPFWLRLARAAIKESKNDAGRDDLGRV